MLDSVISFITQNLSNPFIILALSFFFMYVENIFPPSPSDVILVFLGTFAGIGVINFYLLLGVATIGSVFGFTTMFLVGKLVGERITRKPPKYIKIEQMEKVRTLFARYGYFVIVINRFLSGTRAVVAFFAGLSKLDLVKSIVLAGVSAFLWNTLLIYLGLTLGKNWRKVEHIFEVYWKVFLAIVVILSLIYIAKKYIFVRERK